jgi:hypothetical protein
MKAKDELKPCENNLCGMWTPEQPYPQWKCKNERFSTTNPKGYCLCYSATRPAPADELLREVVSKRYSPIHDKFTEVVAQFIDMKDQREKGTPWDKVDPEAWYKRYTGWEHGKAALPDLSIKNNIFRTEVKTLVAALISELQKADKYTIAKIESYLQEK